MPANAIAMTGPAKPGDWRALAARRRRLYDKARDVTTEMKLADADGCKDAGYYEARKARRGELDCAAHRAFRRTMEILAQEREGSKDR